MSRARLLIPLLVAMLVGCAAPAAPILLAPQPVVVTAMERDQLGLLLELEDRRSFDSAALTLLADAPSALVRRHAALSIGRLRDPRGVPLLRTLLVDPDTAAAATAAFALGQVGDTSAVPALSAVLRDPMLASRVTVAAEAASALGKLQSVRAALLLDSILSHAVVRETAHPSVIGAALLATWKFPRPLGLEPISRWLAAADPELRWRAAYALVRRPHPAAALLLAPLAGDPSPMVRSIAVRGLTAPLADSSSLGAAAALPLVLAAVVDSAYPVRINAVRSLGTYADARAVERLERLLASPERHVALAAAESLGRLGPAASAASAALRGLAVDAAAAPALRQTALESLSRVDPPSAAPVADALAADPAWRLRASAARAYSALGTSSGAPLRSLTRDRDPRVATAALQALIGSVGDSLLSVRGPLLEALGASDAMLRATALGGLRRLADPATLPVLLDAYDRAQRDSLNDAALAAVSAIAALRGPDLDPARAFFARFGPSPDHLVRLLVHSALAEGGSSRWGAPLPPETGRTAEDYRELVDRWVVPPLEGGALPTAEIATEEGIISLELYAAEAPLTVENFAQLARRGYCDGQQWPRVVPNFVVQGGDPRGDQSGGPGYSIRDEINRHLYHTGTLGMALSGPDTGGSQWFITHAPQPHLDGGYTVFGGVLDGQQVAERLLPGDSILRIRVQQ